MVPVQLGTDRTLGSPNGYCNMDLMAQYDPTMSVIHRHTLTSVRQVVGVTILVVGAELSL